MHQMVGEMIRILGDPLEGRASLTAPSDVRVWRVQCLSALAVPVSRLPSHRPLYLSLLRKLLEHRPNLDCDADAQV
jgi:hypothetical protein